MKALFATVLAALLPSACQFEALGMSPPAASALSEPDQFVRRQGTTLFDGSHAFRGLGSNRFDLVAGHKSSACQRGNNSEDLYNRQLATLQTLRESGGTVMRLWAFQAMAGPSGEDFAHLDSLIGVAHEVGINLILVLENHYGECTATDTPQRDLDWYKSGYQRPYGGYSLSFTKYVEKIVKRYANETAIIMWQIVNEAHVPGHPAVVRGFLEHMTSIIRRHDRIHLVCGGGSMDCGSDTGERDFEIMAQVPGMDVLDVHDFGAERVAWTPCLAKAKAVADRNQLSLMVGESGIAHDPKVPTRRAYLMRRKMQAAADHGVSIYLLWSMNTEPKYTDSFDVLRGDPVWQVVQEQAMDAFGMSGDDKSISGFDADSDSDSSWTQLDSP